MKLINFTLKNGLINNVGNLNFKDNIVITTDYRAYSLSDIIPIKCENTYKFCIPDAEFAISYNDIQLQHTLPAQRGKQIFNSPFPLTPYKTVFARLLLLHFPIQGLCQTIISPELPR